jgi:hypothetical protein
MRHQIAEQQGIITNSDQSAFTFERVDFMCDRTNYVNLEARSIGNGNLYVVVDPCGGGASCIAIIAGYINETTKTLVVVGGETEIIKDDAGQEKFLNRFMERLRSHSELGNAMIVAMVERNYGGGVLASRIANILGQYKPIQFMSSDKDAQGGRAGPAILLRYFRAGLYAGCIAPCRGRCVLRWRWIGRHGGRACAR